MRGCQSAFEGTWVPASESAFEIDQRGPKNKYATTFHTSSHSIHEWSPGSGPSRWWRSLRNISRFWKSVRSSGLVAHACGFVQKELWKFVHKVDKVVYTHTNFSLLLNGARHKNSIRRGEWNKVTHSPHCSFSWQLSPWKFMAEEWRNVHHANTYRNEFFADDSTLLSSSPVAWRRSWDRPGILRWFRYQAQLVQVSFASTWSKSSTSTICKVEVLTANESFEYLRIPFSQLPVVDLMINFRR